MTLAYQLIVDEPSAVWFLAAIGLGEADRGLGVERGEVEVTLVLEEESGLVRIHLKPVAPAPESAARPSSPSPPHPDPVLLPILISTNPQPPTPDPRPLNGSPQ